MADTQFSTIVIDLDGTLLNSRKYISERSIQTLNKAISLGIKVIISTARSMTSMRDVCEPLNLIDPIVSTNGAEIWNALDGPLMQAKTIEEEAVRKIMHWAQDKRCSLKTTLTPSSEPMQNDTSWSLLTNPQFDAKNVVRILAKEVHHIPHIEDYCNRELNNQCRTEVFYNDDDSLQSICILSKDASKGTALRFLKKQLNISQHEILVFGDNTNDLSMIPEAQVFIAMSNAPMFVKEKATTVGLANDEDGVAVGIETLVFNSNS